MSDIRYALIDVKSCSACPYHSPEQGWVIGTCVHGLRRKTPYDFRCERDRLPDHCPLPKTPQEAKPYSEVMEMDR